LATPRKNTFSTKTTTDAAQVTSVNVSGAQPTSNTYTVTASGNQVTLTRSSDSAAQTLTLSNIAAGGNATLNFSTLGITIGASSASGISATNLAAGLANAANDTFTTSPNTTTTSTTTTYTGNVTTLNVAGSQPV